MREAFYRDLSVDFLEAGGWLVIQRVAELCHLTHTARVLVFDSGPGEGAALLCKSYRCRVTAVDPWPDWLEETRRRAARHGVAEMVEARGDAGELALPDSAFDLVLTGPVRVREGWSRVWRALRWGGYLGLRGPIWTQEPVPEDRRVLERAYGTIEPLEAWRRLLEQRSYTVIFCDHLSGPLWREHHARLEARIEAWRAADSPFLETYATEIGELAEEKAAVLQCEASLGYGLIVARKLA